MRSVWQSLAWKEWHEHKWKLAALTGVLCGVTSVALLALLRENSDSLDGFLPALVMGMFPLTLFIAAGEAAGENAGRTMPFLQSLPEPMWKAAAWKLVFGAITCLLPVLFTLLLISGWYYCAATWGENPRSVLHFEGAHLLEGTGIESPLLAWNLILAAFAGTTTVSLLVWTAALGVNRKSEVAAGGVALLGIIGWWVVIFVLAHLTEGWLHHGNFEEELLAMAVLAASPGGLLIVFTEGGSRAPVVIGIAVLVAIAADLLLARWYAVRFGRAKSSGSFSPQPVAQQSGHLDWLGVPRRSPLTAIVWKQFRESGPVAAAGLAAILFFVVINVLASPEWYLRDHVYQVAELHAGLTCYIGFLVTLIVGIGVFDRDLSPQLHTFWRSRPVNPDLWYWTKYLTGLIVLVVALGIPLLISGTWYLLNTGWWLSAPPDHSPPLLVLAMVVSIFVAVYALALTTICLVRVTIYAAILGVGVLAGGMSLTWYIVDANNSQWTAADWMTTITAMTSVMALLVTLVGWWAVRRDIGWRKG